MSRTTEPDTRVKTRITSQTTLPLDNNNNIASISTPTLESSQLQVLSPRQARLQLWPLSAIYDNISLTPSRRESTSTSRHDSVDAIIHTTIPQYNACSLIWTDLTYAPPVRSGRLKPASSGPVLKWMSGQLSSGSMTALMGPSGAGKTTLLNCIAGKIRKHVTGQVLVRLPTAGFPEPHQSIRICFVPQDDHMFMQFTVRETIMFASQVHSPKLHPFEHKWDVQETLGHLDLVSVADLTLSCLSGGQLKRTSIALELISKPDILILDEPTTGLDSDNSEKLVQILKNMTKPSVRKATAVISAMHQPSTESLMMFDDVYLLDRFGGNVFFGSPHHIIDSLKSFGFDHNANISTAEFMIEVANGKYGDSCFKKMAHEAAASARSRRTATGGKDVPLHDLRPKPRCCFLRQFHLILCRYFQAYAIKSRLTVVLLLFNMAQALLLVNLSAEPASTSDGCWTSLFDLKINETTTEEEAVMSSKNKQLSSFDLQMHMTKMTYGTIFLFAYPILFMLTSISSSLSIFPAELKSVSREISNYWYTPFSYFLANTCWQIMTIIITTAPAIVYSYAGSGFPFDDWHRFAVFSSICFLQSVIWTSRGLLFSIIFVDFSMALGATVFLAVVTLLFSGVLVPVHRLNPIFKPLAGMSDIMYEFSSLMTAIYGYSRCSGGLVTSDIVKNLLTEKSVMRLTSKMWPEFNRSQTDRYEGTEAEDVGQNYFHQLQDAMNDYFGSPKTISNDDDHFQSSFVLDHYQIRETDMPYNYSFLISVVIVTRIFILLSLKLRNGSHRL